jgi:hypothetical protein
VRLCEGRGQPDGLPERLLRLVEPVQFDQDGAAQSEHVHVIRVLLQKCAAKAVGMTELAAAYQFEDLVEAALW